MSIVHKKLPVVKLKDINPAAKAVGGTITDWQVYPNTSNGYTVHGVLTKDLLNRFDDNTSINTSNVEEFYYDTEEQQGWAITRNTRYYLGNVKEGFNFNKLHEQLNQF